MYPKTDPATGRTLYGEKKCETCGDWGDCAGTCSLCADCWEVQRRLARYLESPKGRAFVLAALQTEEEQRG